MSSNTILILIGAVVAAFALAFIVKLVDKKIPRRKLNQKHFTAKWQRLQKQCAKRETWSLAVIDADSLLDEALKSRHFKGKAMGERLVSAQRLLSDNDAVWSAHKLRNKVAHEGKRPREKEVKDSLVAFRQALRDLGALS